jgi:hypothetical protein
MYHKALTCLKILPTCIKVVLVLALLWVATGMKHSQLSNSEFSRWSVNSVVVAME